MLTRDYFDLLVEHLSTTSNQIPHSNKEVFQVYYDRIVNVVNQLKAIAYDNPQSDPRLKQTLAILIYSSITFSRPQANVQASIRDPFFQATFWSVYRYIPNIIVFVATDSDRLDVERMQLPAIEVKQLNVPRDHKNRTVALPRYSLAWIDANLRSGSVDILDKEGSGKNNNFESDPSPNSVTMSSNQGSTWTWGQFKYVFFSEGDQILHMRQSSGIYDMVDHGQGKVVVVPHRMQTLPLMQTLPDPSPQLEKLYTSAPSLNLPNSTIVQLDMKEFKGSCCDSGRYEVTDCGRWWYQCGEWGLKDINPWIQFGSDGYTSPITTAHKGKCTYSPEIQVCTLPKGCRHPVPPKASDPKYPFIGTDVCEEMPIRVRLGPDPSLPQQRSVDTMKKKKAKRRDDAASVRVLD
eukprot:CAMPEP_0170392262 /NCGR_PEP_ID=MMETSP0117_2-20130122/20098_1 /TAXON_ID=400756 /ORGANISM="Durinskia baltica, Strain CSIRO CS-38" /LENGTH=405 /DNA_ID=CAMNT_0010648387 /DNA_START=321 /DNA_END=1538 /DNA_ORIENTATION=-